MRLSNERKLRGVLGFREDNLQRPSATQAGKDLRRLMEQGSCRVIELSMRPWDSGGTQRDAFIVDLIGIDEIEDETAMIV